MGNEENVRVEEHRILKSVGLGKGMKRQRTERMQCEVKLGGLRRGRNLNLHAVNCCGGGTT
jgi:hypothetical protein